MADLFNNSPLPGAVEIALNRFLQADTAALELAGRMAGKTVAVQLTDLGQSLFFSPRADGMQVRGALSADESADASISASLFSFARLAVAKDKNSEALATDLRIDGDSRLAQQFQELLEVTDFDWEEQLSKFTGDVIASQIGKAVRGLFSAGRDSAERAAQEAATLLTKTEAGAASDLVQPAEAAGFMHAVETLQDDVARLEARIAQLVKKAKSAE